MQGYSLCQIESKAGIGRSTVENIKKEMDSGKEHNKGEHFVKLSPCNKQALIWQITLGHLNTVVQAIH